MAKRSHSIDMIHGSLVDKILLFAFPLMLSSVLQLLFNAADIIVVGRFAGKTALAAVGSTSSLINLTINIFIGLSVGCNVVVARYKGAGDIDGVSKTIHTSILIALIGGIIVGLFGCFASHYLLELMSSPEDVIDLSTLYLRIYFLGMPAVMLYNFGAAILRAHGDTKRPLYYLAVAGVVNVVLNLILVVFFHMSVAGVAIATIVSQYISGLLVMICLMNEEDDMRLELTKLRIEPSYLLEIIRIGLPAGLQGTLFSLSNVVIQASVNSFGSTVVAGNTAASNIEGFVYAAMNAFYQAAITFTGQNMGAKQTKRVNRILLDCQVMVVLVGALLGGLVVVFSEPLLNIYAPGQMDVIMVGKIRLSIICTTYFLCGMMDVMVGSLRGIGYSVMPMIVSLCGACGLRLIWIATVFRMNPTIQTLYISYPISWFVTFLIHLICFFIVRKKAFAKLENN